MSLKVLVNIISRNIPLEGLSEIKRNLEFLAGQPPLKEIYSGLEGKKIDYEKGHRVIIVNRVIEGSKLEEVFEYTVIDHANVEDIDTRVGSRSYNQKEIEELRRQAGALR